MKVRSYGTSLKHRNDGTVSSIVVPVYLDNNDPVATCALVTTAAFTSVV